MNPDAIASIYASDVVSGFDIHKPEKLNTLFARFGDQGASAFQIIRSLGFEKEVSSDTFSHYEENRRHENVKVAANVAQPAIGADISFTIHGDSLDNNNRFYLRRWDELLFRNDVIGSVTNIDVSVPTAPVVTVRLNIATERFPALTLGEDIVIHTNAFSEGSGQPTSALKGVWEYVNDTQIIKETIGVTGSEMVNQTWIDIPGEGGKPSSFYMLGQTDIDYRMALRIDGAFLYGKRATNVNLIDPTTGRRIRTTEGLIPAVRRLGNPQAYTPGANFIPEFDEMDRTLDRQGAGNYILGLLGINLHQDIENSLVTYFANTNIAYARQTVNEVLFNSNESLGASVNFKYLTKSERTFMFKRLGVLNNPKLYGTAGYNGPQLGVFLPLNKKKDPVTKGLVESIGARYRGLGKYKRRMEVWQVGGAGEGLKVTEFDVMNTFQRCHVGAHFRGLNQFVLMHP